MTTAPWEQLNAHHVCHVMETGYAAQPAALLDPVKPTSSDREATTFRVRGASQSASSASVPKAPVGDAETVRAAMRPTASYFPSSPLDAMAAMALPPVSQRVVDSVVRSEMDAAIARQNFNLTAIPAALRRLRDKVAEFQTTFRAQVEENISVGPALHAGHHDTKLSLYLHNAGMAAAHHGHPGVQFLTEVLARSVGDENETLAVLAAAQHMCHYAGGECPPDVVALLHAASHERERLQAVVVQDALTRQADAQRQAAANLASAAATALFQRWKEYLIRAVEDVERQGAEESLHRRKANMILLLQAVTDTDPGVGVAADHTARMASVWKTWLDAIDAKLDTQRDVALRGTE